MQSILNNILFSEKFPPPNTAHNSSAGAIHNLFWNDAHNRNLRLENTEIEVRLGRAPTDRGAFETNVSERVFTTVLEAMQGYGRWDAVHSARHIVGYCSDRDESIRIVLDSDGRTTSVCSKQRVLVADFAGDGLPFDFRLAVSLELPVNDPLTLEDATRTVVRERSSFTLGNIRYDLSRVTHLDGRKDYQIELELVDPPRVQMQCDNAKALTAEFQRRLSDVMAICEPIGAFRTRLLRKRYY